MLRKFIIISFVFGIVPTGATAGDLPPLGKRKYLISAGNPASPVKIQNAEKKTTAVYLKDPMNSKSQKRGVWKASKRRIKLKKKIAARSRAMKPSKLAFRAISVNGRKTKPRVRFVRDLIEVKRADEPLGKDFYQRVFLPAKDANF